MMGLCLAGSLVLTKGEKPKAMERRMNLNEIPEMTDPLGKHWEQPRDIRDAPMDAKLVLLTPRQFVDLLSYDSSMPSGVYPGKCWKRTNGGKTWLVWYGAAFMESGKEMCPIHCRAIEVVL